MGQAPNGVSRAVCSIHTSFSIGFFSFFYAKKFTASEHAETACKNTIYAN